MSTAAREERIRVLLAELLSLANIAPQGVFAHAAVSVAVPVTSGSKLILGALTGSNLDSLLAIETSRRIGMGTYRMFLGIFPEPPAAVITMGAS